MIAASMSTGKSKPAKHIMVRLYDHVADHKVVLEWIAQLPKDTAGRPRLSENVVRLILQEMSGSQAVPAPVIPIPSIEAPPPSQASPEKEEAKDALAHHETPTANTGETGAGGGAAMPAQPPDSHAVSSLVANLRQQLDAEEG